MKNSNKKIEKRTIGITDTTLRDGQQSLIATRMTTEQMLPIVSAMDDVGFHSVEMWGGATFDACMRFINEDPWIRLRKLKDGFKKTKLQMLLRGQNLLGYRIYPDDVVEYFIQKSVANGIDIIRMFDALNDTRNLQTCVKAAKKEKCHVQIAIGYTLSHVHTIEYYKDLVKRFESMGADSICIKDMAALLLPKAATELVTAIKSVSKLPLQVHTHYTTGLGAMAYMSAIEAGADILDTAISPFAFGSSQPATDVMVGALADTEFDTGLDQQKLAEIASYFKTLRDEFIENGLLDPSILCVDYNGLIYQVPGGMLSNLVSQLKAQNRTELLDKALAEVPRVREDMGMPPLVTPSSQIVGTQAVLNVIAGERYKICPKETKDIVRGMYGKTPVDIKPEFRKQIIGDEKPITTRPADLLSPALPDARKEIESYIEKDEDVLSYALFPNVAINYFKYRNAQKYGVDENLADKENKVYPV